jgi:hypothetical protein
MDWACRGRLEDRSSEAHKRLLPARSGGISSARGAGLFEPGVAERESGRAASVSAWP